MKSVAKRFFPQCWKVLSVISATLVCVSVCSAYKDPPRAAVAVDYSTGDIIYSSNLDVKTQPASMAKMMTLLIVFKALRAKKVTLDTPVRISKHAASQRPSKLGLRCGDAISMRDAILALIVKSANDIAVAVAECIGGSEANFVALMNKEAKQLRMNSTVFRNPSGWKNSKQLTTVRDMSKLARALIKKYPEFFKLFSKRTFHYRGKRYKNHNDLLGENGGIVVDGLKTGFLCVSGYNIAVTAKKGHDRIIIVVVGEKTLKKRRVFVQWLMSSAFNRLAEQHFRNYPKTVLAGKLAPKKKSKKNSKKKIEKKESDKKYTLGEKFLFKNESENSLKNKKSTEKNAKKSRMRMILERAHLVY